MKKYILIALLFLSVGLQAQNNSDSLLAVIKKMPKNATIEFKNMIDGDSGFGFINDVFAKTRGVGHDCPEDSNKVTHKPAQPFAKAAKDSISNYLKGKTLKCKIYGNDKYGRILVDIFVKIPKRKTSISIAELAISKGWAWAFFEYQKDKSKEKRYLELEAKARKLKLGLWNFPNPVRPSEYREKQL